MESIAFPLDFVVAALAACAGVVIWRLQRRRNRPARLPFPEAWRALLKRRLPILARLTPEQRALHERHVQDFFNEIRFIGCNGFEVTEDMRVLVAGMACLLILRPDAVLFRGLSTVLLYPTAFWVRHQEPDEFGLVSDEPQLQIGESWNGQRVVLSWEDVEAALDGDPVNVVVHEFAHQLDDESPGSPGAPKLADYGEWSRVMQAEFDRLKHRASPVLDDYGLEGPTEFFAVATEAFFQNGRALRRHHRPLYLLLRDYYRIETD
jgi:Mlc titration factor MtfA (ptsG expression regulator)